MNECIVGMGLIATAVLKKGGVQKEILLIKPQGDNLTKKNLKEIESKWRQKSILYSADKRGLSNLYHGVTPAQIYQDHEKTITNLDYANLKTKIVEIKDYSFVPYKVERTKINIKNTKYINVENLKNYEKVNLCSSVIGNLRILMKLGEIEKSIKVGDHLVVKLCSIKYEEYLEKIGSKGVVHTPTGVLFKHMDFGDLDTRVFFRPNYGDNININFTDTVNGIAKFLINKNSIKRIKSSLYNKFGIKFPATRVDIYAQIPIRDLYCVSEFSIVESLDSEIIFKSVLEELKIKVRNKFDTVKFYTNNKENILPGIHLFYNRAVVQNINKNIKVYDTSLCPDIKAHPTVWSSIVAYEDIV